MPPALPDPPDGPLSTLELVPGETRASDAGSSLSDPGTRWVGRILAGRYLLERVIGRGGMGIVFQARHVRVGRAVAVKVLRPDLARVAEATARFHREAQAAAAVGSEHIVEVFDYGYGDDGEAFIVMELLEGEDLGALVRRVGALPAARAVEIVRQIAVALQAAHDKGIIHRDLKSENVFILARDGADFVKVVDFGISKVQEAEPGRGPITQSGTLLGTPHYMAPEQGAGQVEPDHRIDVYALGCLFYEMLTGQLPFTGRTAVEVMYRHVHEAVRPPSRVLPTAGISPVLDAVVLRALAKDRDQRFASAHDMAAALPPSATAQGAVLHPVPAPRRWRKRAMAAGLIAAFSLGAVVALRAQAPLRTATRPRDRAAPALVAPDAGIPVAISRPSVVASAGDAGVLRPAQGLVVLALVVRPVDAEIRVDGERVGAGDYTGRFSSGTVHQVTARAPGYLPREESLRLDADQALRWTLARASGVTHAPVHGPLRSVDAGTPVTSPLLPPPRPAVTPAGPRPEDGLRGNPFTDA